jgi:hypothetical protein
MIITDVVIKESPALSGQKYYHAVIDWGFKKIKVSLNTDGYFMPHLTMDEFMHYLNSIPSDVKLDKYK